MLTRLPLLGIQENHEEDLTIQLPTSRCPRPIFHTHVLEDLGLLGLLARCRKKRLLGKITALRRELMKEFPQFTMILGLCEGPLAQALPNIILTVTCLLTNTIRTCITTSTIPTWLIPNVSLTMTHTSERQPALIIAWLLENLDFQYIAH